MRIIKCRICDYNNPILYKKCRKCSTSLRIKTTISEKTETTKRMERLGFIHSNLTKIQEGISLIPEEEISYTRKQRVLYLLVINSVNECMDCFRCLEFLAKMGDFRSYGDIDLIKNMIEHVDSHDNNREDFFIDLNIKEQSYSTRLNYLRLIPQDKIQDDNCAICIEELKYENILVSSLPCGHVFHTDCVKEWIENNNTCPLGRCPIVSVERLIF